MASEAQIRASVKFNKTRDSITIRPDKETGTWIRQAAKDLDMSVSDLIILAVKEYLNKPCDEERYGMKQTLQNANSKCNI